MDRFKKLLAAATLLVLPVIAACGEDVMPPPPTGSIVGQVSIDGMGADGVTVSLSNGATTATAGGGNYRFETVEQGSYTVTISGFPADASFDATSKPANIGDTGGTETVDFRGDYIRTASIMGTVTVENMGLGGVTVRLSGMADSETATDDSGQYSFTGLRSGTYSVEISGFDSNEVSFSSTSGAATVGVGESKVVSFDGTYLRTAGVMGQVTADGDGLPGVTVTLMGEGAEATKVTDAGGLYAFSELKSGDYTVAISGYDTDDYEFETTSKSVTIATGETANVPFDGTLLRTAGIAGRVSLDDGMGLDGVTVTLAGAAESTTETSNGGQYSFAGLAAGTYVLTIENPNETAYSFAEDEMQKTVMLEDDQSAIVNFSGTHTSTASISGVLFIDEVDENKMLDDDEPTITAALAPWLASLDDDDPAKAAVAGLLAKAKVKRRGPDLNEEHDIDIMPDGSFSTGESLMAGSYQVELPVNDDDVAAGLEAAGVAFVGESMVVNVEAGGRATVNFPFRITMQTVVTGARMGGGGAFGPGVEGVKLALYARADGTVMLDEATTDEMGMATFNFLRDANTGPAGNDNIVFVKAMDPGHDALVVSGNEFVEINHASTARLYEADEEKEVATLVNIAVAFDFSVKSNETARGGDMGLGGWQVQYCMLMAKTDDADAVVCEGDDAAFMDLVMGEGDDAEAVKSDDGETDMADLGKVSYSAMVTDPTMLPVMVYVRAKPVDVDEDGKRTSVQPDMGEIWKQGDALMHKHTGLDLPPAEATDEGSIRITYTTQAVYVGTHRELDDRTGFTDYFGLRGNRDARPTDKGTAIDEIDVKLMTADDRGRLRIFKYDHDLDPTTDDIEARKSFGKTGMVSFAHVPAETEITIVADAPGEMIIVPDNRSATEIDAFGDQLDDYPDGIIEGAFGDMGGARPDVWICPLTVADGADAEEDCSTFAYKWATGTISGNVTGLRKGDEEVMVTLTPVNSNDDYAGDLAMDTEVKFGATQFSFDGVADGKYAVTLKAVPGKWKKDAKETDVMHDEARTIDTYTGDAQTVGLSATDLRGVIKGVIGRNINGTTLSSGETIAGAVVNLHYAKKVGGTGANKNQRIDGGAVLDDNGDPITTTTDKDGVYSFPDLATDTVYLVKAQGTDLYAVVRNGDPRIGSIAEETSDVVSHALVWPSTSTLASLKPGIPQWDAEKSQAYNTSNHASGSAYASGVVDPYVDRTVASPVVVRGIANFVLLYKDGEIEGVVNDPGKNQGHKRSEVELRLCKTTNAVTANDVLVDNTLTASPATRCSDYAGETVTVAVNDDKTWSQDGLREGRWEVVVDPPPGFVTATSLADRATASLQQMAELEGDRDDYQTNTFFIRDQNAGQTAELSKVAIVGGKTDGGPNNDGCPINATPDNSADNRCIDIPVGTSSFKVTVTASDGAIIRLSPDATDATASGSVSVTNKKRATVAVTKLAGTTVLYAHVSSGDGYTTNSAADRGFAVRRNADVRVKEVTVAWSGFGIVLGRDQLGLGQNPDGETSPVVGTTGISANVNLDDTGAVQVPTSGLTLRAVGMNSSFVVDGWAASTATGTCDSNTTWTDGDLGGQALAAASNSKLYACLRMRDSGASGADENTINVNYYKLALNRSVAHGG